MEVQDLENRVTVLEEMVFVIDMRIRLLLLAALRRHPDLLEMGLATKELVLLLVEELKLAKSERRHSTGNGA